MTVAGQDISPEEARRAAAADWLLQLDEPDVSEAQMHAWLEWFGASEENRKAFEEMQSLYLRTRALPVHYKERLRSLALHDSFGDAGQPDVPVRSRSVFAQPGLWALAASVATVVIAGAVFWKMSAPFVEDEAVVYAAPADRHRTVHLNDGSELALGADAIVAVSFSDALRAVELERGQTYFEVEKDVGRPFVVHAGDVRVTAVGTAFNVVRNEQAVTVTVTEGAVEIARIVIGSEAGTPVRVSMGERKVIPFAGPESTDVAATVHAPRTAWRDGRVEFTEATLEEVLPLVNEHAPRILVIDDPRVADLVYSGTILQPHVGEWIDSLPRIFPVRQVALEDGTTTLVMDNSER